MFTRRKLLQSSALGMAILSQPSLASQLAAQDNKSLLALDATGLAELIRTKQVSPREVVEATIRCIETGDGPINAVVTRSFERALAAADKVDLSTPFAGVPFAIKDNMDVAGVKTTHGSRWNKDDVAKESAAIIKAYENLGFIIVGKTNMPEHGAPSTTEPKLHGPCRNPWNLDYSPGGSSGGAAAAVAMGYMPAAHGNDGGGSLRIPASSCGVFSLKPTRYRMLGDLQARPRSRFKSEHIISRSVRDNASVFYFTQYTGRDAPHEPIPLVTGPVARRLKIGLTIKGMNNKEPHADVKARVEETARRLESAGHAIIPLDNPFDGDEFTYNYQTLFAPRIVALIEHIEKTTGQPIEESRLLENWAIGFGRESATRRPEEYGQAEKALVHFQQLTDEWMLPVDVMLTPVNPVPSTPIGYLDSDVDYRVLKQRVFEHLAYTPMQNALGTTAMSVPSGFSRDGLPIGSHFIGRAGDEATLFGLAFELEQLQPWADRWAPHAKVPGIA